MTRHWTAIPLGGLGLLCWASLSQAAPVPPAIATEGAGIIHKVHGTHRACRYSPALDWWHRHVGPYNQGVSCGPYRYYEYDGPFYYQPFFFFEPYQFRERRFAPRFRDGGRFDGRRFERPHRDGSGRRR
jgi:hypothetical protein